MFAQLDWGWGSPREALVNPPEEARERVFGKVGSCSSGSKAACPRRRLFMLDLRRGLGLLPVQKHDAEESLRCNDCGLDPESPILAC